MDKVLLVDKPKDWTSFDVVAKVRSIVRKNFQAGHVVATNSKTTKPPRIRVGHAGTLDPLASGLLLVLVGKATKRQDQYMKRDKTYIVEATLGYTSTTGDAEGDKTSVSQKKPSLKSVRAVCNSFVGTIQQTPPMYSAIKIGGQRAYKLARAGKEITIKPRTITIHSISDIAYDYPKFSFVVTVSSGTYVRSLVADIGLALGTGAYMSELRRTSIGTFDVADAINIDQINKEIFTDQ